MKIDSSVYNVNVIFGIHSHYRVGSETHKYQLLNSPHICSVDLVLVFACASLIIKMFDYATDVDM